MDTSKINLAAPAQKHAEYLARMVPIIRSRLTLEGKKESEIAAYLAALPPEPIAIAFKRLVEAALAQH